MTTTREQLQALMDAPLSQRASTLKRKERLTLDGVGPKKRTSPVPRGHAAPIGTGPAGETCGSCRHMARRDLSKTYLKCALMRAVWTGGGATDVRAGDAACRRWEVKSS
jgi:hypothetical protein